MAWARACSSLRMRAQVARSFAHRYVNTNKNYSATPITWATFGIVGAGGFATVMYFLNAKQSKEEKLVNGTSQVRTYGKPAVGGPFSLVDEDGRPVTDASYPGKYLLIYFGFTYCPDICPSELVKIGKVLQKLESSHGIKDKIQPLFISLDGKRDSIAQMKQYKKDFHPSMHFLTGTPKQLEEAARYFRVYFADTIENEEDTDDYLVDHSIVMYLINPEGEFEEFFTQMSNVQECVMRISKIVHAAD